MTAERIFLPIQVPPAPGDDMVKCVRAEITHLVKPDGTFTPEDVEQVARDEYARRGWVWTDRVSLITNDEFHRLRSEGMSHREAAAHLRVRHD